MCVCVCMCAGHCLNYCINNENVDDFTKEYIFSNIDMINYLKS